MNHRRIAAAFVTFMCLAALSPREMCAQAATVEQLTRRVAELERRVAELEQRLRALESPQPTTQPDNRPDRGNSRDIANWRRLQVGMTMEQVAALLGQPERVSAIVTVIWNYPGGGTVMFNMESKKVEGWQEPRATPDRNGL